MPDVGAHNPLLPAAPPADVLPPPPHPIRRRWGCQQHGLRGARCGGRRRHDPARGAWGDDRGGAVPGSPPQHRHATQVRLPTAHYAGVCRRVCRHAGASEAGRILPSWCSVGHAAMPRTASRAPTQPRIRRRSLTAPPHPSFCCSCAPQPLQ